MARAKRTNAARLWAVNRRFGSWRCHGSGDANVVWTSLTTNNVSQFLSTAVSGCGKGLNDALEEAGIEQLTEEETKIPGDLLAQMLSNRAMGIFLFEGRALREGNYHGTKHIILRCYRRPCTPGDGSHLFELKLPISVSPVEDMFRWVDYRYLFNVTNDIPTRIGIPWNHPDNECNGRHYVFVHGYNVSTNSALGWASEMFKRLRQSGSQAMFTAVDWYGNQSYVESGWIPLVGGESPNYYINVKNAFETAPHIIDCCAQLPGGKILLAHSLGNVVVSSASIDYGLQYKKYYMLNAAVPMEAYDDMSITTNMVAKAWRSTPSRIRSSEWSNLFDNEDGRSLLSWRGRFAGIANAVNCYSITEDILGNTELNESQVGRWWGDRVWAMQELNKGTPFAERMPDSWANSEGGWGFNLATYNRKYINRKTGTMTKAMKKRIPTITDDELKANPVFKRFDESWLHSTNSVVSMSQINTVRARILGDGIPATSFASGANKMDNRTDIVQVDYHLYVAGNWPHEYDNQHNPIWLHSDIKKVAFFYLSRFFRTIVNEEK